jgi:hypothetical protein
MIAQLVCPDSSLFPRTLVRVAGLVCLLLLTPLARAAVGDESYLAFAPTADGMPLVSEGKAAAVVVDDQDWPGVIRVATDLQADIERVSGIKPELLNEHAGRRATAVIVGTIGKSRVIDQLVREGKIDGARIAGRWEAFLVQTVTAPLPGIERALVIAGSDKRGTIYGVYGLSEQIGVSPWYWWADVPVAKHDTIFVQPVRHVNEGPVVQYRGLFINDEAPALTNWVYEKFGAFDHTFYTHVFELILRLRGNYLWPAMWQPRAFNADDPLNPKLADEYGVVMGTSHHEPLMRAHDEWGRFGKGSWNYEKNAPALREFWRGGMERVKDYEGIVSLGMRGDGDEPMSEGENVALLERIVRAQRQIISDVSGKQPEATPQLWALYKEVQGYYERGMRVPDDVILLWCDDNWGNNRRLPTPEEQKRPGGAGVYYHFDYVGGPRNYKWLNTVPITKVWEQMHLAWQYQANRIWIVNVGDIKPMEFPIEFFINYAWNPARWPYEQLGDYTRTWAAREFGAQHAAEVAALIDGYTKLNSLRKPEMLAPDTLSLVNYREAERVLGEWRDLTVRAEKLNTQLPQEARDAFYQLVLYPVKASGVVHEIYVAAGKNRLYAVQGRAAANTEAARVRTLFDLDQKLVDAYHALGGGKWNHQMDQSNMGYTYWQTPNLEVAPAVSEVRPYADASPAIAIEGSVRSWHSYGAGRAVLPPLHAAGQGTRWIEVFNRGLKPFTFRAAADQPWVKLSASSGTVEEITRIEVGADWAAVPAGNSAALITLEASGQSFRVQLPVENPDLANVSGFVETDRHVAIEAPNFARAVNAGGITWKTLPNFGRTQGGVMVMPVTAPAQTPGGDSPRLEYEVNLTSTGEVTVELHCAPSLDFQSGAGLQFAVSFDDAPPQIVKLDTWATLQTWEKAVSDGVRRVATKHRIAAPGRHVLKFWMVTPGVVLERLVIDAGGGRPSYLGPIESPRVNAGGR